MGEEMDLIRVLLADDFPIARAGIRAILEKAPDIEVIGEAADGQEAKHLVETLHPDVLLLDLVMPGLRPSEVEKWVRDHHPETVTLVLTAHDRDAYLAEMIEAGAAGYLEKGETPERLIEAIRQAVRGDVLYTAEQMERHRAWREEVSERLESLTDREREVLELLAKGRSPRQVAEALFISVNTVRTHIGNLLEKLEASSRAEAIVWAWRHGLIEELGSSD